MKEQNQYKLYAAIVLSMVCFALSFVWFKIANFSYGPLTIVFFRLIISSVILLAFSKLSKRLILPDRKDFKYLLLLAFFEPFLYFMGESYGLQYLSSTVGAVIIATIPLVAPLAVFIFFNEKISLRNIIGILISFFGVAGVVFEIGIGITASPVGILLVFGAVFAAVGYTIVLQKISKNINNLSIILIQNIIGSIYFLPFWLIFEKNQFIRTSFDMNAMLAILYLAIFASSIAFIFFTYSVRHMGITKANMFVNTIPVFTAIFAWLILGEMLNLQKIIGIVTVIAGIFFAQMNWKKRFSGPDPIPRT